MPKSGLPRIDRAKLAAEGKADVLTLLCTSDLTIDGGVTGSSPTSGCAGSTLLMCTVEIAANDTWRNISHTLDTIRLVTLATDAGTVTHRTRLKPIHHSILRALDLADPRRHRPLRPPRGSQSICSYASMNLPIATPATGGW